LAKWFFENGLFKSSSFNPYVKRNNELTPSFSFEESSVWNNGVLKVEISIYLIGIMVNLYQVPHMEWFGIMEFLII
jgi:hypothetical protein